MSRVDEPQKPNCFSVGSAHQNTDWSRNQDLVREIPGEVKIGGDEK